MTACRARAESRCSSTGAAAFVGASGVDGVARGKDWERELALACCFRTGEVTTNPRLLAACVALTSACAREVGARLATAALTGRAVWLRLPPLSAWAAVAVKAAASIAAIADSPGASSWIVPSASSDRPSTTPALLAVASAAASSFSRRASSGRRTSRRRRCRRRCARTRNSSASSAARRASKASGVTARAATEDALLGPSPASGS